jgi:hypothetical protein
MSTAPLSGFFLTSLSPSQSSLQKLSLRTSSLISTLLRFRVTFHTHICRNLNTNPKSEKSKLFILFYQNGAYEWKHESIIGQIIDDQPPSTKLLLRRLQTHFFPDLRRANRPKNTSCFIGVGGDDDSGNVDEARWS